ncbi:hypothetical protein Tco_0373404, partial [Tanacetum coccineum]
GGGGGGGGGGEGMCDGCSCKCIVDEECGVGCIDFDIEVNERSVMGGDEGSDSGVVSDVVKSDGVDVVVVVGSDCLVCVCVIKEVAFLSCWVSNEDTGSGSGLKFVSMYDDVHELGIQ